MANLTERLPFPLPTILQYLELNFNEVITALLLIYLIILALFSIIIFSTVSVKILKTKNESVTKEKLKGDLVYLVVIQDVHWVLLLLLQSPQCVLELCLKVRHLTGDQSLSRKSLTLTLYSDLLAVNDLMRQNKNPLQANQSEPVRLMTGCILKQSDPLGINCDKSMQYFV